MKSTVRMLAVLVVMLLQAFVIVASASSQQKAISTLYFFFSPSGCSYCRAQAPVVERFQRDHPEVKVIGIPLWGSDEAVRKFVSETGITFVVRQDKEKIAKVDVARHPAIAINSVRCDTFHQISRGSISYEELNEGVSNFLRSCQERKPLPGTIHRRGC